MVHLGDAIELIKNAGDSTDAFQKFCRIMREYGYERVVYSLITDHPSLSLPKQHGLATSYPEHWMKFYNENNYLAEDPVIRGVMQIKTPFFWDDLRSNPDIPEDSLHIIDEGYESGVRDGIAFPLYGGPGELCGIGLARADSDKGRDYEFMARANLLATFFHEKYRSFLIKPPMRDYTEKEIDILCWAAEGKTDEEISLIMGISPSTVRFYWNRIFKKLDTKGRVYSVTKAVALNIISPRLYHAPVRNDSC